MIYMAVKTLGQELANYDPEIESDLPLAFTPPGAKNVFHIFKQVEKDRIIFHNR